MQAYSNPARATDPHALPDVEIFHVDIITLLDKKSGFFEMSKNWPANKVNELVGYYYWYCLPGCLPDSEPEGPFETVERALEVVQSEAELDQCLTQAGV